MAVIVWFTTLASVILFFVLLGNIFVIVTVCKEKKISNFKNILILTLSIADVCVGAFVIPAVITFPLVHVEWGGVFCCLCHHTAYSAAAASVFSLCVVAFDRFWVIVFPLKAKTRDSKTMGIILGVAWVLALLYGLRASLVYEQFVYEVQEGNTTKFFRSCSVPAHKIKLNIYLVVVDCIVIFVIPFLIIMCCHIAIAWRLCKPTGLLGQNSRPSDMTQKYKIVKHLLALTAVFLICHAPLHLIRTYTAIGGARFDGYMTAILLSNLISFFNAVLDVFLYATMSSHVRSKILQIAFWRKLNKVEPNNETLVTAKATTQTKNSLLVDGGSSQQPCETQHSV